MRGEGSCQQMWLLEARSFAPEAKAWLQFIFPGWDSVSSDKTRTRRRRPSRRKTKHSLVSAPDQEFVSWSSSVGSFHGEMGRGPSSRYQLVFSPTRVLGQCIDASATLWLQHAQERASHGVSLFLREGILDLSDSFVQMAAWHSRRSQKSVSCCPGFLP